MPKLGISQEQLQALLLELPRHEPAGVKLLRQLKSPTPGQVFPTGVPRKEFAAATEQAVKEHDIMDRWVNQLRRLPASTLSMSALDF